MSLMCEAHVVESLNFGIIFFSAKRIRDTISELLGSLQWLAISQQKAQLLSGLPSLSLRLVS